MVWEYGPQGQTEEAAGRTQGPPAAAPRTQTARATSPGPSHPPCHRRPGRELTRRLRPDLQCGGKAPSHLEGCCCCCCY